MTDWDRLVPPRLHGLEPYRPTEPPVQELWARLGEEAVGKLNWNESLFGPFPGSLEAAAAELARAWMYPEQTYADFRRAVADRIGVGPERVVPAHGVQALIETVATVFLDPGDVVVVPSPTYGLYAQASAARGATVIPVPLRALSLDAEALATAARQHRARLVWVCDPNNPTGSLLAREEWEKLLDGIPEGCALVVDEAYIDYVDPKRRLRREEDVEAGRPVVLLRSFSKLFGLAGLRLGYAVVDERLARYLDVAHEPFNVNRVALAAGRACLERVDAVEERRRAVVAARERLSSLLLEAGAEPLPSQANFVLARVGVDDKALVRALAEEGLLVRAGSELGLPGYVRVTVGPPKLMERLAATLARLLPELAGGGPADQLADDLANSEAAPGGFAR